MTFCLSYMKSFSKKTPHKTCQPADPKNIKTFPETIHFIFWPYSTEIGENRPKIGQQRLKLANIHIPISLQ